MSFACLLELITAIIAFGARAGHDALFGLLRMGALLSAIVCVCLATCRTGLGWAGILFGDATARRERQSHGSCQQHVLHVHHGGLPGVALGMDHINSRSRDLLPVCRPGFESGVAQRDQARPVTDIFLAARAGKGLP